MATVEVSCAECGHVQELDEAVVGTQVKCPKCKFQFLAETGDAYGLAGEPAPAVIDRRSGSSSSSSASSTDPTGPRPKPVPRKPEPARPETKEERALRERMERWAEKMDQ